jgi:hypothetical protein
MKYFEISRANPRSSGGVLGLPRRGKSKDKRAPRILGSIPKSPRMGLEEKRGGGARKKIMN